MKRFLWLENTRSMHCDIRFWTLLNILDALPMKKSKMCWFVHFIHCVSLVGSSHNNTFFLLAVFLQNSFSFSHLSETHLLTFLDFIQCFENELFISCRCYTKISKLLFTKSSSSFFFFAGKCYKLCSNNKYEIFHWVPKILDVNSFYFKSNKNFCVFKKDFFLWLHN